MTEKTTIRIALLALVFVLMPLYWKAFPPREPISDANGVYENPCCGTISLEDGALSFNGGRVSYVVEHDKNGRYVLPDEFIGVSRSVLYKDKDHHPLMMRLNPSHPPATIELSTDDRFLIFNRQK